MDDWQTKWKADMAEALGRLFKAMPVQRGIKVAERMDGYLSAVKDFTAVEVNAGIDRYLAGKVPGLSKKFCPSPPELAEIVAGTKAALTVALVRETGRSYAYKPPRSAKIYSGITKDQVRQYRAQGIVERGVIWLPGLSGDPAFGDLYAPDPDWQPPTEINP